MKARMYNGKPLKEFIATLEPGRMTGEMFTIWEDILKEQKVKSPQRIKILVRKNLKMSPGKIAAQSVHAALALACLVPIDPAMSVVVLEVNGAPFDAGKAGHSPVAVVRDAGYTEVVPGTETCIAFLEDDPRAEGNERNKQ